MKAVVLVLAILSSSIPAASQQRDHWGRDFFIAFGANTGGERDVETENSVALTIVTRGAASVRITIAGLGFDSSVGVAANSSIVIELSNGNNGTRSAALARTDNGIVIKQRSVHVTSDLPIALFGRNHKRFSEDAFLALPVSSLGTEYRVVSFPASGGQVTEMPGEFAVVATQDGSQVQITPRCPTLDGRPQNVPFTVQLDRGDIYLCMSESTSFRDLSGSLVTSNAPIAVFSGHERASVPIDATLYDGSTASRDHLYEQLPPVTACGDTFYVVPLAGTTRADEVRLVTTINSTVLNINSDTSPALEAGKVVSLTPLVKPAKITSSKPLLVAQYLSTTMGKIGDPNFAAVGDPAMMLVVPTRQWLKEYDFHTIDLKDAKSFATIVLPAEAYSFTTVDGVGLDTVAAIEGTGYVYTGIRLTPGHHVVKSVVPIGVSLHGLNANAESYAMPAGMGVEPGGLTWSSVDPEVADHDPDKATLIAKDHRVRLPAQNSLTEDIRVYDRTGRMVGSFGKQDAVNRELDVAGLASGLYFYRRSDGFSGSFLVP